MAITIEVHNISTVLSAAALAPILAAIEGQVAQDVAPAWGCQGVSFVVVTKFSAGKWHFVVADTSDQAGAAGYHETASDEPIGYAFAKTTQDAGMHPSVTISHEILEMVGDALIDQSNQWSDLPHALFLAQELCDPVEDDSLGYFKTPNGEAGPGVLVSDFVTPAYFVPGAKGRWDFMGHLKGPNTLAAGGYQSFWDPTNGWTQKFADGKLLGRAALESPYSRRNRRAVTAR